MGKQLKGQRYIQLALDYTDLDEALRLVSNISDCKSGLIVEVGTPLIKSVGARRAISSIRDIMGEDAILLADMKTVDVGSIEAELAFGSGADITTVLGAADDETIAEAVKASKSYGGYVQVDMINHPSPINRALEAIALGAQIIGLHAGIDVQRKRRIRGVDLALYLKELREVVGDEALISIAGGIRPDEAGFLADRGADIIVIGSAITRSVSPRESLLMALERLGYRC